MEVHGCLDKQVCSYGANAGYAYDEFDGYIYDESLIGFDQETNLNYNYFRDYDPATGRYVQSDPIGLRGGINTYSYVGGQPLKYADPTGQCPWCIGAAIGGIAGAVGAYNSSGGNWGATLSGGLVGAGAGALSTLTFGATGGLAWFGSSMASGAAAGFLGNVAGQATGQVAQGQSVCIDLQQAKTQALVGMVAGVGGASFAVASGDYAISYAYGINSLSAATSGAISSVANASLPGSAGGMRP